MNSDRFFLIIIFCFCAGLSYSQMNYRIKADFSIKEKTEEGKPVLIVGKVYYDRNYKKIVYDITFPEKEIIIADDSATVRIQNGAITGKQKSFTPVSFSVFHIALNNNLDNFGLKESPYKMGEVERDKEMVITTWLPPEQFKETMPLILTAQKEKKLYGMVFKNSAGVITGKQFFNNYENYNGLVFPAEFIQISYVNGKELNKVTTFRNIAINKTGEDEMYNYKLK